MSGAKSCLALEGVEKNRGYQTMKSNLSVEDYVKSSFKYRKTSELNY